MLLVDDLLLFPVRGLLWVFKEIHHAAQEERANEVDDIRDQLRNLYMMLETARISEEEFAVEEKKWLDRLETLERGSADLDTEDQETNAEDRGRR